MSTEKNDSKTTDVEFLVKRIQVLKNQIEDKTRAKVRKKRRIIVVGLLLSLVFCFALTRLTLQGRELDADALTQIGRFEIQKRLPDTRQMLQDQLEQQAPYLVSEGFRALLEMVPSLRLYLLKDLNTRIDGLTEKYEQDLTVRLSESIRQGKARIDSKYPDKGDREKLELFLAQVSDDFTESFRYGIDGLYEKYSMETQGITDYIDYLYQRHPEELESQERIKKEIIQTMVQLLRREEALGK
jgi:hypothetical protein